MLSQETSAPASPQLSPSLTSRAEHDLSLFERSCGVEGPCVPPRDCLPHPLPPRSTRSSPSCHTSHRIHIPQLFLRDLVPIRHRSRRLWKPDPPRPLLPHRKLIHLRLALLAEHQARPALS